MSSQETSGIQCPECGLVNHPDRHGLSSMQCAGCDHDIKILPDDDVHVTDSLPPIRGAVVHPVDEDEEDYFNT